jgi:hypothetical protein
MHVVRYAWLGQWAMLLILVNQQGADEPTSRLAVIVRA